MRQILFEQHNQGYWDHLEKILASNTNTDIDQLPKLYRQVCHDLALAKQRRYTPALIEKLNKLVMRGHHRLYQRAPRNRTHWLRFIIVTFPQSLRRNAIYVYLALLLFCLPGIIVGTFCYLDDEMIYSTMPGEHVQGMESMYDPKAKKIGRERESDTDLLMFGFYIKNNIGIGFRTFAGGIFFCLGSIFFLLYNGTVLGAVAGHLTQLGYTETFYPFVIGHGAFELSAIVFSGAAGLKLGFSLIKPGPYRRALALKLAAREAIIIMAGAALMLVIAAFLEAFWSSSTTIPSTVKYSVGGFFWFLVITYCVYSGRRYNYGSEPT